MINAEITVRKNWCKEKFKWIRQKVAYKDKKQIDSLPEHAQHIYKKTHDNAIEQYQNPDKDAGVRVKVLKKWHTKLPGRQ